MLSHFQKCITLYYSMLGGASSGTPIFGHNRLLKLRSKLKITHLTSNQKNKGVLFSSIVKVGENKVSLFFGLEVI